MQRFTRIESLLGLGQETPQVGDAFIQDAKQQRAAEAEARKQEFERFAQSASVTRQSEQERSSAPVHKDRLSIIAQALNGDRAPGEPLGLDAYHMSSQSVKRAGIEEEHENNFGAAMDPTTLASMHMFQSREAYEKQFDDLAEEDKARKEARKASASRSDDRRGEWESSIADRVAELMSRPDGSMLSANEIVGGTVQSIGGVETSDSPFGLMNYDAAESREASVQQMRDARVARQQAIARDKSDNRTSVNEDLASKMRSSSIQSKSVDGGLAARVAAALQRKSED